MDYLVDCVWLGDAYVPITVSLYSPSQASVLFTESLDVVCFG